jgi:hypothetical protein
MTSTTATAATIANSPSRSRFFRHVGPVLAGLFTGLVLSLGTDTVMRAAGVFPRFGQPMSDWQFLLATAYRTGYSVLGSYLAARLSATRAMRNAMILGVLEVVACTAGLAATWNKGPEFGPAWYPIALVLLALPCAWLGGKLALRRSAQA